MTRADIVRAPSAWRKSPRYGASAEILVNVQGDEPLIEPAAIDAAVAAIRDDAEVNVATLAVPIAQCRRTSWTPML